jgi:hypothetical protein
MEATDAIMAILGTTDWVCELCGSAFGDQFLVPMYMQGTDIAFRTDNNPSTSFDREITLFCRASDLPYCDYIDPNGGATLSSDLFVYASFSPAAVSAVPVPPTVWLFGSALIGLVGFSKRKSRIAA